jgi:hypothetical protein
MEDELQRMMDFLRAGHLVRYPPQFSIYHPSTQETSTQGKSIIQYNPNSMIIFYQPINFYSILNLILFTADYPDEYTAT